MPDLKERHKYLAKPMADYEIAIKRAESNTTARILNLNRQYTLKCESLIRQLVSANKIEEAKIVKAEVERIRGESSAAKKPDLKVAIKEPELNTAVKPADVNAREQKKIVVIWNCHNSYGNDWGSLECDITLYNGDVAVFQKKGVKIPWKPDADTNIGFEVPG